ncbi:hypothetical protein QFZ66_004602 [Streptomyces sp. B4I13]|uniref:hypothetical protein n=1 Tax=Streptomyces sp. B4I13 TaxID=3042271 RepID=UPI002781AD44|nr:hypothetical protein [Streptomyces sp. B4I13]MDQ0960724.1 hypothetical protein [Streptomyces sp. B4I13]
MRVSIDGYRDPNLLALPPWLWCRSSANWAPSSRSCAAGYQGVGGATLENVHQRLRQLQVSG